MVWRATRPWKGAWKERRSRSHRTSSIFATMPYGGALTAMKNTPTATDSIMRLQQLFATNLHMPQRDHVGQEGGGQSAASRPSHVPPSAPSTSGGQSAVGPSGVEVKARSSSSIGRHMPRCARLNPPRIRGRALDPPLLPLALPRIPRVVQPERPLAGVRQWLQRPRPDVRPPPSSTTATSLSLLVKAALVGLGGMTAPQAWRTRCRSPRRLAPQTTRP